MGGDVFVPSALIASAGNNANEYLAKHVAELGYLRPTIVASGGEARRRMGDIDFEVVIINTPLPDEFGHELSTYAVEKSNAGVILLAKAGTADQISDKLQQHGVLVLAKPFTGVQFRQAVQLIRAEQFPADLHAVCPRASNNGEHRPLTARLSHLFRTVRGGDHHNFPAHLRTPSQHINTITLDGTGSKEKLRMLNL